MAVDRSGLISLGSLSKAATHGILLDRCKEVLVGVPVRKRKQEILDRLEVSEIVDILGLREILQAAFIVHRRDLEADPDAAKEKMLGMVLSQCQGSPSLLRELPPQATDQADQSLAEDEDTDEPWDHPQREPEITYDQEPALVEGDGDDTEAATDKGFALTGLMTL